jgi:serine protease Do
MLNSASRWLWSAGLLAMGAVGGFFVSDRFQLQAQSEVRPAPTTAIPKELTSYRDIVKKVVPAVVSIEAKIKLKRRPIASVQNGLPDELLPTQGPKTDTITGFGSGVVVDPKGVILTNYHVVDNAESLDIRLPDGRRFTTRTWNGDRKTDIAIIRVPAVKPLPFLEFADSDQMEVGDRVLAVGAPFGLTGSVTHGIISAKSRNVRLNQYEDFLQTDAAINPGNSGGPLVNLEGKVIGLNSAIKSKSGGFQGVGLAISSNLAKQIMQQLLKDGSVKRGYLGVQVRDIDGALGTKVGVKEGSGVLITKVFDQSPAAKGGVRLGDVLHSINGKPVRNGIELQKVIAGLPLNQPVEMTITRDGSKEQMKLTIEEQPDEFGDNPK